MRIRSFLLVVTAILPVAFALPAPVAAAEATESYVIVTADRGVAGVVSTVESVTPNAEVTEVFANVGAATAELTPTEARRLAADPDVVAIEPNGKVFASEVRSPVKSWGLDRIDQTSLPLDGTYRVVPGPNEVTVYVLDSGINTSHVEFAGRLQTGAWYYGSTIDDCNGHGTHVAGTAAGKTYGVNSAAKIVPVKVLDCDGSGSYANVLSGLDWVVSNHQSGPAVVNMSLGGSASSTLDAGVNRVIADGVPVVVAAGNWSDNACNYSPARTPNAITVGAVSKTDTVSSFSNYGACLDLSAPGEGIISAYVGSSTYAAAMDGTSMAAPHVAGAVSLILSHQPDLTPAQVRDVLLSRASGPVLDPGPQTPTALLYSPAPSAPAAPAAPSVTATRTTLEVSWTAPDNGGTPITGYTVTGSPGNKTCTTTTATSCLLSALSPSTTYSVSVTASNAVGASASSPATATKTLDPVAPSAPSTPTLSAARDSITASWTAPADNGDAAITSYTATAMPGNKTCIAGLTSCTISGLDPETTYDVTVTATNSAGTSPASASASTTTLALSAPSAPAAPTLTATRDSITASWTAPADNGGAAITSYTATASPGGQSCTTAARSCVIASLDQDMIYSVSVTATNSIGTSAPSLAGSIKTQAPTAPAAPAAPTLTATRDSITASWTAPADNGSAITGYTATATPGNKTCTTSGLSCTISGLSSSTTYSVTVTATNDIGTSSPSTAASIGTLAPSVPTTPSAPTLSSSLSSITASWSTPADTGGAAITSYTATATPGNKTCTTSGLSCTISGLSQSTTYTVIVTATNAAGTSNPSAPSSLATTTLPGSPFVSISPTRVLDSRNGTGGYASPWGQGTTRNLSLSRAVPASATAVVMNFTVTEPTAGSFATIWPAGGPMPVASSHNWAPGDTWANLVTVPVSIINGAAVVSIYNNGGQAHFVADVVGYYDTTAAVKSSYLPVTPTRVLDSRNGTGGYASPWSFAGESRQLLVAGPGSAAGVPADATAVVLNLTQTNASRAGFATAYPAGESLPLASNLNWPPGSTRGNLATVKLGANGRINLYAGGTDLIADVVGYYTANPPATASNIQPVTPTRILDSRTGLGGHRTPWGQGTTRSIAAVGQLGAPGSSVNIPSTAKAVVVNITVADTTAAGWLAAWASGTPTPLVSNLNWAPGQVVPNMAIVKVGADGRINLLNSAGSTSVIVDIVGYMT